VAEDIEQIDVQLRIVDSAFEADNFMPEANAADIVRAVSEQLEKGGWNLP
jgi:hypothetical protein